LVWFLDDSTIVAHNASFDISFLNVEMDLLELMPVDLDRTVVDSLEMARKLFPEQKNNLDSLLERFCIKYEHKVSYGALLDAQLLAEIYLELKHALENNG
jgi:DNA polymerase-3 subunit epsilon